MQLSALRSAARMLGQDVWLQVVARQLAEAAPLRVRSCQYCGL